MSIQWSEYQKGIFNWVAKGTGHGEVVAVAGASKTTSAVESINHIDWLLSKRFAAFNKSIRDELSKRVKGNCEVVNFNGFGHKICMTGLSRPLFNQNKTLNTLQSVVSPEKFQKTKGLVVRLVSLLKGTGCLTVDQANEHIPELLDYHDINVPSWAYQETKDLILTIYNRVINNTKEIDYDDQLFFPIKYDLSIPLTDFLIIDEAQDMNAIQTELMIRSVNNNKRNPGRIMFIGDPEQSIYGFRGATPDNMRIMSERLNATKLPLYICYRCPRNVVVEAKQFVSHIEPWEKAKPGTVDSISKGQFIQSVTPNDFVLCRTTEPLVRYCLEFIRMKRRAYVKGRDIGDNLIRLIEVVHGKGGQLTEFLVSLGDYQRKQNEIYSVQNKEKEMETLQDKVNTLSVLCDGLETVTQLINRIEEIFPDEQSESKQYNLGQAICFMTVHRSKGLETKIVYILNSKPLKLKKEWQLDEERRLKYVAITRATEALYYVTE